MAEKSWCERNGASFDVLPHEGDVMIEVERERDAWESDRVAIFVTPDEAEEICARILDAAKNARHKKARDG